MLEKLDLLADFEEAHLKTTTLLILLKKGMLYSSNNYNIPRQDRQEKIGKICPFLLCNCDTLRDMATWLKATTHSFAMPYRLVSCKDPRNLRSWEISLRSFSRWRYLESPGLLESRFWGMGIIFMPPIDKLTFGKTKFFNCIINCSILTDNDFAKVKSKRLRNMHCFWYRTVPSAVNWSRSLPRCGFIGKNKISWLSKRSPQWIIGTVILVDRYVAILFYYQGEALNRLLVTEYSKTNPE